MAYQDGVVGIHARVKVRMYAGEQDTRGKLVESTVGRLYSTNRFLRISATLKTEKRILIPWK